MELSMVKGFSISWNDCSIELLISVFSENKQFIAVSFTWSWMSWTTSSIDITKVSIVVWLTPAACNCAIADAHKSVVFLPGTGKELSFEHVATSELLGCPTALWTTAASSTHKTLLPSWTLFKCFRKPENVANSKQQPASPHLSLSDLPGKSPWINFRCRTRTLCFPDNKNK